MKKVFVILWKYIDVDYTEQRRTFIVSAENDKQAVESVKSICTWNKDKEDNSDFYGFIVDGFTGITEVGNGGDGINYE